MGRLLTRADRELLNSTADTLERMRAGGGGDSPQKVNMGRAPMWLLARLGTFSATLGYTWYRVNPNLTTKGEFEDWDPAESGDGAWERGGNETATGVVVLHLDGYESNGKPVFGFNGLTFPSVRNNGTVVKSNPTFINIPASMSGLLEFVANGDGVDLVIVGGGNYQLITTETVAGQAVPAWRFAKAH